MTTPPAACGVYRVEVPLTLGTTWLSLNKAPAHRGEKIRWDGWKKRWRRAAFDAMADAELPQEMGRIRLQVELRFVDGRTRDPSNFVPTFKPMIDALQPTRTYTRNRKHKVGSRTVPATETVTEWGWGVVEGDDPRYVEQPEPIIGEPIGRGPRKGIVIFHITPLDPDRDPRTQLTEENG